MASCLSQWFDDGMNGLVQTNTTIAIQDNAAGAASLYKAQTGKIRPAEPSQLPVERKRMKSRSRLFYFLSLVVLLAAAFAVSAMSSAGASSQSAASAAYQATVVPTVSVGVTPPVIVVTGAVPVTGEPTGSPNWFFLTILVVAGLAFLVAIAALLRRPYD